MIPLISDPWLFEQLSNLSVFITLVIFVAFAVGLASRSMALGSMAAYLTFAYLATETGIQLLERILIVSLVVVFVGFAFKFWRLEGFGGSET